MTTQTGAEAGVAARPQRTFLGHPIGLYVLFFTEMWERFSYYGMRALLMLYLLNYFRMTQANASMIYKWYTSFVYLTPLLGGYLADRYLGNKRAVVIGAVLMAIGHFLMAFEPMTIFIAALVFLIIGNGFFKPNMSTQVGRLYPPNDPRRDGAYTIFYMGINLGAFLSPLVCGWLAQNTVGRYHSGFTVAGIGMVLGLVIYLVGLPWVRELIPLGSVPAASQEGMPEKQASKFLTALRDLQKQTMEARSSAFVAMVHLADPPAGLDLRRAGFPLDDVRYDGATQTLIATKRLGEKEVQAILTLAYPDRAAAAPPVQSATAAPPPLSEQAAEQTPSALPALNRISPKLVAALGCALLVGAPLLAPPKLNLNPFVPLSCSWIGLNLIAWNTAIALEIGAICALISAKVLSAVHRAERDRVLAIFAPGVFAVCFWAAYEQAGNAMNVWADKTTNRYLTSEAKPPELFPQVEEGPDSDEERAEGFWDRWLTMFRLLPSESKPDQSWGDWWYGLWNPVPAEWFQSINALAIFVLAPPFAFLWTYLERRGFNPSIATKMALGLVFMGLSFALMIGAARKENQPTSVALAEGQTLPAAVQVNAQDQLCHRPDDGEGPEPPYDAGRLKYDAESHRFELLGVLSDIERDHILRDTAPPAFVEKVKELEQRSNAAEGMNFTVSVQLEHQPPGFDLKYAGFPRKQVSYDPQTRTLSTTRHLADKDVKALLMAAGDPDLRETLNQLMVQSSTYQVSSWWLFWFYILTTVGELCLSPVGLSMVSKLAPVRFATMLMGLWLLTSFFGNFAAGAMGEIVDQKPPEEFFLYFVVAMGVASLVLFLLVRKIVSMMHGVN